MKYNFEVKSILKKKLEKLAKKDSKRARIVTKKFWEVIQSPQHYKNLRAPLQHLRRVHISKSFVLVFSVDEQAKTVTFEDYDHHDNVYRK